MLYAPRETMRRVLDTPGRRWTIELIALAFIVSSFGDPDIRRMPRELPGLTLVPTLAIVVLVCIATAIFWVLAICVIAWLVTLVGRRLDGKSTVADVRAALAWALVPMIWSIFYRIPISLYQSQITVHETGSPWQIGLELLEQGTLSVALIVIAIKLVFDLWVVGLAAINVSEAMRFETWKGFSAVAVVGAAPFVIAAAAVLATHR